MNESELAPAIASKTDTGTTIALFDKAGLLRAGLVADSQPLNTNAPSLFDQTGKMRIRLALGRDGVPDFSVLRFKGERIPAQ